MAITDNLTALYTRIAGTSTLPASVAALFEGLATLLAESDSKEIAAALAALTTHPDDENRQIAWAALLAEALTRNTSHVAVKRNDPLIDILRESMELPAQRKAARSAAILIAGGGEARGAGRAAHREDRGDRREARVTRARGRDREGRDLRTRREA